MLKCIASASKNENYLQFTLINLTINSILNPHCLYNYTILGSKCTSYKKTYTKKCLNFNFFHTLKFINVNFLWISKRWKQSYKATRALCIYWSLVLFSVNLWWDAKVKAFHILTMYFSMFIPHICGFH
jgi:hypothetical protein